MATDMTQELAAVIAAKMKAAKSPEEIRAALRETKTTLNRLAGVIGALLVVTEASGWQTGGRVGP